MAQRLNMRSAGGLWLMATAVVLLLLVGRMVSPNDLYNYEQPKTISYTMDVLNHGHWVVPYDMFGRAPHKPPLYNWISLPATAAFGPQQWALKFPSLLAGLFTLIAMGWIGAWWYRRMQTMPALATSPPREDMPAVGFGLCVAVVWWVSSSTLKLFYIARPDMLMAGFLAIGWFAATRLLCEERLKGAGWWRLALWLSVAGAGMCKGPPALLPVIYIVLGSKLLTGRWSSIKRTGMWWGLPLAVALISAWLGAAYLIDRHAVVDELIGDQALGKITRRGKWRIVTEFYKSPGYWFLRFLPWSVFTLFALVEVPVRKWFSHVTGPAILWLWVVILFFMCAADKRGDYLAPANLSAAVLAVFWLLLVGRKYGIGPRAVLMLAALVGIGQLAYLFHWSDAAETDYGSHVADFTNAVSRVVGDEPIVCINTGYNPVQTLLGVNQNGKLADAILADDQARWLIQPVDQADRPPMLKSQPIPEVYGHEAGVLGLYRLAKKPADSSPDVTRD